MLQWHYTPQNNEKILFFALIKRQALPNVSQKRFKLSHVRRCHFGQQALHHIIPCWYDNIKNNFTQIYMKRFY